MKGHISRIFPNFTKSHQQATSHHHMVDAVCIYIYGGVLRARLVEGYTNWGGLIALVVRLPLNYNSSHISF